MIRSERLLSQLMLMEGLRLEAYKDAAGVWTIGYGHTQDVRPGDKISEYCAKEYLLQDLYPVEQAVNKLNIARTEGQFDALVSFAFNLGIDRLKKSTLLDVSGKPAGSLNKDYGFYGLYGFLLETFLDL